MIVCTGNICRSPMAEVVLRERFAAAGLGDQVVVDSTGVSDEEDGNPIDRRARAVLVSHGYPAGDGHRARQVRPGDERDLVLAMTNAHARALRRLGIEPVLFRSFDPDATGDLDVADPWYGGASDFEDCLAQIEAAADGIVEHVRAALGNALLQQNG
ncbi:low molecular weight phosphotyrosine protein phosphatase [Cellulomonas sp. zg-ZUI188]|uniref:protein-tyrosine-phosphatase n=2 Tax=Cellulomonas fengjieae TaxID=2819978 RepID=A0ABS3SHV1_9CELL|nr:low molecular weight phosphotyrosine protein phosphatase [Cellulomonas fengjieae]MBO3101075.1 low molecular weight phosphotyrosine protein phosphatase [Cellulomonas fengjieae]QVI67725.1 low molecular weight phosphotyrosine protein phosphatase [Cellulomonas fengjieae]